MVKQMGGESGFEDDESSSKFSVTNPIKMSDTAGLGIGAVIKYTVIGFDSQGRFEVQRRYNEFMALQKALNESWPGCYVPAIPEKQFIGDKDEQFVEERRQLLERFICELSKYNYLVESREFQIFARGEGEQTSNFETLVKETPSAILVKYRNNFPKINENTTELPQYTEKINIF